MLLRHKLNLVSVGWCGMASVVCALTGQLGFALLALFLAYLNWLVVLASEDSKRGN